MSDARTIFLDTNSQLHYPQMADIDFCALAGVSTVKLIACLQFISELDDKKSDSRLASRANRAIQDINMYRQPGNSVRPGVTLEVYNRALRISEFPDTLSPDSKDDRILHLAKKYQEEHPSESVCVLTEDLGMTLRCEAHGMPSLAPEKSKRLPTPQSEIEKKYQESLIELRSIKSRAPALTVCMFPVGQDGEPLDEVAEHGPVRIIAPSKRPQPIDIETLIVEERRKLLAGLPNAAATSHLPGLAGMMGLSQERIDAYRNLVDHHLEALRDWYSRWARAIDAQERRFMIGVQIGNAGASPALDVELLLRFPEPICSVECDDSRAGEIPLVDKKPKPPVRPRNPIEEIGSFRTPNLDALIHQRLPNLPYVPRGAEPSADASIEGNKCELRIRVPQVNQHKTSTWSPIHLGFRSWKDIAPCQVNAVLISASTPEKREWTIPIVPRAASSTTG